VKRADIVFWAEIVCTVKISTAPPLTASREMLLLGTVIEPVMVVVVPLKEMLVVFVFRLFMSVVFVEMFVVFVEIFGIS
jgi:hypothetical protein